LLPNVMPVDDHAPQQIRPDPVLLAADLVTIAPEVPGHLARPTPGCLQELRVDQPHQRQVFCRLAHGLVGEPPTG